MRLRRRRMRDCHPTLRYCTATLHDNQRRRHRPTRTTTRTCDHRTKSQNLTITGTMATRRTSRMLLGNHGRRRGGERKYLRWLCRLQMDKCRGRDVWRLSSRLVQTFLDLDGVWTICKSKSDMYWRGIGYSEQDRLLACIRHTRTIRMTVRYLCPPD